MRAKTRKILFEVIERGVNDGYRRAFKHTNDPSESTIKESIMREITYEIDDNFDFDLERE